MTEVLPVNSDDEQRQRRADRERRNPDLPRSGESFAQYQNRTRGTGSRALERFAADRGMPNAAFASSERGAWERSVRQFNRANPEAPVRVPGFNALDNGRAYTMRSGTSEESDIRSAVRQRTLLRGMSAMFARRAEPDISRPRVSDDVRRTAGVIEGGNAAFVGRDPIDIAATVSGAPRGYLRALARQEGGDNPNAINHRSGASGLMQFTDGTWLSMMRQHGAAYGIPQNMLDEAQSKGQAREQILALRFDPEWSAIMGGHLFNHEADVMARRIGGQIRVADVYLGHFLGGEAAGWWIRQQREGRGHMNAREAIRMYYRQRNRAGYAELVIAQNPRQFAENATVASVYRMQTEDLIEHGRRNGVDPRELRALVGVGRANRRAE
jgi:soluble lytic murein transglycosylase-like protein